MNPLLMKLLARYMAPAGDGGSDAGGAGTGGDAAAIDWGNDFTPTDDEAAADGAAAAAAAAAKASKKTPTAGEGEGDDEGEEEEGDEGGDAAAAAKAEKKREQRIPLSRHKEVLDKERGKREALERQLAQFQRGGEVADLNEAITKAEDAILALEKQYTTFLADGELDKAADAMAKIRATERKMSETKSDMKIAAAESRATERARYDIALERIENAYDQLNEDHDDFDADLMEDVIDLKGAYERKGLTPTAAMQKAVDKLLGSKTKKQEAAIDTTPRVDEKATKDVAAERKQNAVKKALDAAAKQPPSTTKVGMDSDKAGAMTMADLRKLTPQKFAEIPEDQLAIMRGDIVA